MRTAVGRHALRVLLVGGVFALGLLYGGQARAAESAPAVAESGPRATAGADVLSGTVHADGQVLRSVAGRTEPAEGAARGERSVDERIVQPLGEAAGTAQGLFGRVPSVQASDLLPPLPRLPSLPAPSGLPEPLPEPPSRPDTPSGQEQKHPRDAPPEPADTQKQKQKQAQAQVLAAETAETAEAAGGTVSGNPRRIDEPVVLAHGPRVAAFPADTPSRTAARPGHRRSAHGVDVPLGPEPVDGAAGDGAAGDGGPPRHADTYAVTADHRAPTGLLPGAVASAEVPGVRDRHRDVPLFPG
ncbi:hypothetical protein [Streptomyces sp. NPDC093094]|uniref:hypothetical protein n=1 Tax=Streptomyces sp. NPDC093094 TaxID=3366026 RepID=UPI0038213632